MNAKKAKEARRLVSELASNGLLDPANNQMMVRRHRKANGEFRDTHFWPAGSERHAYQEMKRG